MRVRAVTTAAVAALALAACGSVATDAEARHIVMVGSRGQVLDPKGAGLRLGPFTGYPAVSSAAYDEDPAHSAEAVAAEAAQIDLVVDGVIRDAPAGPDGRRRVLLFVHGGLVPLETSVTRAKSVLERIAGEDDAPYPVFVAWSSSAWSSYYEHVRFVRQGDFRESIGMQALAPLYLATDAVTAVARYPAGLGQSLWNAVVEVSPVDAEKAAAKREEALVPAGSHVRLEQPDAPWTGRLPLALSVPLEQPFVAVLGGTGTSIWENLARRTTTLFHREADFVREDFRPPADPADGTPLSERGRGTGGLSLFLQRLLARMGDDPGERWSVTLVGHSMGAFVVNGVLREFPGLPVDDIVYMAAACPLREYHEVVIPYLADHPSARMFHLTLHDAADLSEQEWPILWPMTFLWPRGSLLVQIDSYYARPGTLLDRTAGRWMNLMSAEHLTEGTRTGRDVRRQIWYRRFGWGWGVGDDQPTKHGDFSEYPFWREGFWTGRGPNRAPWDPRMAPEVVPLADQEPVEPGGR